MNKEVYRRLSKAERKLENTNRLRTNNSTLRIKYEGVKKLLEKKDKEIERLNNIINELEEELERESNMKEDTCLEHNTFIDIKNTLKTVLKRLQELKGSDKE